MGKNIIIIFLVVACSVTAQPWKNKPNPEIQGAINSSRTGLYIPHKWGIPSPILHPNTPQVNATPDIFRPHIPQDKYKIYHPYVREFSLLPENYNPLSLCEGAQYIYNTLIPSLSDTSNHVYDTLQIRYAIDLLYSIDTTNELIDNSTSLDLIARTNALTSYALLSENKSDIIALTKCFIDRPFEYLMYYADNVAICVCLIIGDEGYNYLRELARQRQQEGKMVSAGWGYAKKRIPDLELSDTLIDSEALLDIRGLEELHKKRSIIQQKIHR